MSTFHFTFMNNDLGDVAPEVLVAIGIVLVLWLWSVVEIARKKTEDPFDRIVWLLIVLALNIVGTFLYLFFAGGAAKAATPSMKDDPEKEIKRRANEGTL
jgi:type VI protein secretion system component VasK